jgi:hypothetical protein
MISSFRNLGWEERTGREGGNGCGGASHRLGSAMKHMVLAGDEEREWWSGFPEGANGERERERYFVGKKDELTVKIIIFSFKTNVAEPRLFPRQSGSKVREKLPDL